MYVKGLCDTAPIISISSTPSSFSPLLFDGKPHQIHAEGLLSMPPVCTGWCPDGLLPVLKTQPNLRLMYETPYFPHPIPGAFIVSSMHGNYCIYSDVLYLLCVCLLWFLKEGTGHVHYVSPRESQTYGGDSVILSNMREICFLTH